MRRIRLDATTWHTDDDVFSALLSSLEAFSGHGHNLNALWDSITEGAKYDLGPDAASYLNGVQPPFHVDVLNADTPPERVRDLLSAVANTFERANAEHGVGISITLRPSLHLATEQEPADKREAE